MFMAYRDRHRKRRYFVGGTSTARLQICIITEVSSGLQSAKPKRCLEGKSASIVAVYLHFENKGLVYKVKTDTPTQYQYDNFFTRTGLYTG